MLALPDLLAKTAPMSIIQDVRVVQALVAFLQPETVLEIGIGAAGWVLTVNHLIPGLRFVGVDNFVNDYGLHWPKTAAALLQHAHRIADDLGDTLDLRLLDQNAVAIDAYDMVFDVIRLDCLDHMADVTRLIDRVMPFTSPDAVFFVDDIIPRICPGRYMAFMEEALQDRLVPIWFGHKEGLWGKSSAQLVSIQQMLMRSQAGHLQTVELHGKRFPIYLSD